MQQGDSQGARQAQRDALDRLDQALQDLQNRLDQLQHQDQLQKLLQLAEELEEMIKVQRNINEETEKLDKRRDEWKRTDRRRCIELSDEQENLAKRAEKLVALMEKESAVVYPGRLRSAIHDMKEVAELLSSYDTGAYTQSVEYEILKTLEQLAKSLRREYQAKKQRGRRNPRRPGGPRRPRKPPLVPPVAELKMLRNMEKEVYQRTVRLYEALKVQKGRMNLIQKRLMRRLLFKQSLIRELTEKMYEELKKRRR